MRQSLAQRQDCLRPEIEEITLSFAHFVSRNVYINYQMGRVKILAEIIESFDWFLGRMLKQHGLPWAYLSLPDTMTPILLYLIIIFGNMDYIPRIFLTCIVVRI